MGRGFLKLDLGSAFRTIDQFEEDWDFCGIHGGEPEHEDFCAALGHSIFVEAPVIFGRLEMFGHTFSTEDFQWAYQFTPTHELSLSLFVAIGNQRWCPTDQNRPEPPPGDWFLTFSTDGESGSFNYLVNGFTPVGSPWCDNDVCERLAWTSVVPEPGSLALFTLGTRRARIHAAAPAVMCAYPCAQRRPRRRVVPAGRLTDAAGDRGPVRPGSSRRTRAPVIIPLTSGKENFMVQATLGFCFSIVGRCGVAG